MNISKIVAASVQTDATPMKMPVEDIDDDLRARLERLRQERGVCFEQIANEAIHTGLDEIDREASHLSNKTRGGH